MKSITFESFWRKFHFVVNRPMLERTISERLWESTISYKAKSDAFYNINKGLKCSAYQYLLKNLKNY